MPKIITTILMLLSLNCYAEWDRWSDFDKKLFVASQVAIVADWTTTRYGSRHQSELLNTRETNVVLGPYPSTDRVDLYFILMLTSNYYIADYLGPDMRGFYLTTRTVSHGLAAHNNVRLGWQMRF